MYICVYIETHASLQDLKLDTEVDLDTFLCLANMPTLTSLYVGGIPPDDCPSLQLPPAIIVGEGGGPHLQRVGFGKEAFGDFDVRVAARLPLANVQEVRLPP